MASTRTNPIAGGGHHRRYRRGQPAATRQAGRSGGRGICRWGKRDEQRRARAARRKRASYRPVAAWPIRPTGSSGRSAYHPSRVSGQPVRRRPRGWRLALAWSRGAADQPGPTQGNCQSPPAAIHVVGALRRAVRARRLLLFGRRCRTENRNPAAWPPVPARCYSGANGTQTGAA